MIVPLALGAAALYGFFRYQKSKEQAALETIATTPPGFASPTQAKNVAKAVLSAMKPRAVPIPQTSLYNPSKPADPPPGSAYGMFSPTYQAPPTAPAAPAASISTGITGNITGSIKFP